MSFIELKNITKSFKNETILQNCNLNFDLNEIVFIIGKSGCGKTTLLNLIGLIDFEYKGEIFVNNKLVTKRNRDRLRSNGFSFMFQDYGLISNLNIYENIKPYITKYNKDKFDTLVEEFGLLGKQNRKLEELSGGEKQRFSLIKALIKNHKVLLLDEPTGSLDEETSIKLMDQIKKKSDGRLIIIASHNIELAQKYATRIIKMENGLIIEDKKIQDSNKIGKAEIEYKLNNIKGNLIKNTLSSFKTYRKNFILYLIIVIINLCSIITTFGIHSSFKTYTEMAPKKFLDSQYIELENISNQDLTLLYENGIKYKEINNFNFYFNNFIKSEITKQNNISFNFSFSVVDLRFSQKEHLDSTIFINNLFYEKFDKETLLFKFNFDILDENFYLNEQVKISSVFNEPKIYNSPKILVDFSFAKKIFSEEKISKIESKKLFNIPTIVYIENDIKIVHKLLKNNSSFVYKPLSTSSDQKTYYSSSIIYYESIIPLANMLMLFVILICYILLSTSVIGLKRIADSFYLTRLKEYSLSYAYGESLSSIRFKIFIQILIINIISLCISIIFVYLLKLAINNTLAIKLNFNIIEIELKGLITSVYSILFISLLSSSYSNHKLLSNILEELRNE